MRLIFVLPVFMSFALLFGMAQQTSKEVTARANPTEDKRPNNPSVPEAFAVNAHFERVVVVRFKYNADLLAGLKSIIKQQHINNAVILTAIGSVRNYQVHAVASRTFPPTDRFVQDPTAPADIIGMSGYVLSGRLHAHITLSTGDRAFGGHLEPGTNAYTFALVTLGVLDNNADFSRFDNETYR